MLVQVIQQEGDFWSLVSARALDVVEAMKTGKLDTAECGEIELAALSWPDSCVVYDFVLKRLGYGPIRFRSNWYGNKCMWA